MALGQRGQHLQAPGARSKQAEWFGMNIIIQRKDWGGVTMADLTRNYAVEI